MTWFRHNSPAPTRNRGGAVVCLRNGGIMAGASGRGLPIGRET
jgi:hypothetical protein